MARFLLFLISFIIFGCKMVNNSETKAISPAIGPADQEEFYVYSYLHNSANIEKYTKKNEDGSMIDTFNAVCFYRVDLNKANSNDGLTELFFKARPITGHAIDFKRFTEEFEVPKKLPENVDSLEIVVKNTVVMGAVLIDSMANANDMFDRDLTGASRKEQALKVHRVDGKRLNFILEKAKRFEAKKTKACPKIHPNAEAMHKEGRRRL